MLRANGPNLPNPPASIRHASALPKSVDHDNLDR
jgi:hypothetical protein